MSKTFLPNVTGGKEDSLTLDDWIQIYFGLLDYRQNYTGDMPHDEYMRWLTRILSVKAKIQELNDAPQSISN